jgi:hypothetical protein
MPFSRQQRITNTLLLNGSFIDNLGLMHGKMGIAIYFFHLARETKNQIYEDYAGELIDEIYDEIDTNTPCDFENGLAGIGWGIEYLVQNGFIAADTDEALEAIDNHLYPVKFQEIGLLKGLIGQGAYFLMRFRNKNPSFERTETSLQGKMLIHIINELELLLEKNNVLGLIGSSKQFDLVWDYPLIILFLTEVYRQELNKVKVEKLIHQILSPLFCPENIPCERSKQLQLTFVLIKLQQLKVDQLLCAFLEELIHKLSPAQNRVILLKELLSNSATMQRGTAGIAWNYLQLFLLTNNDFYLEESHYWQMHGFEFPESPQGYAGFFMEDESKAFGLINGLAGIALYEIIQTKH